MGNLCPYPVVKNSGRAIDGHRIFIIISHLHLYTAVHDNISTSAADELDVYRVAEIAITWMYIIMNFTCTNKEYQGNVHYIRLCNANKALWLWNPEETSPEIQNRGISGRKIGQMCATKNFKTNRIPWGVGVGGKTGRDYVGWTSDVALFQSNASWCVCSW